MFLVDASAVVEDCLPAVVDDDPAVVLVEDCPAVVVDDCANSGRLTDTAAAAMNDVNVRFIIPPFRLGAAVIQRNRNAKRKCDGGGNRLWLRSVAAVFGSINRRQDLHGVATRHG